MRTIILLLSILLILNFKCFTQNPTLEQVVYDMVGEPFRTGEFTAPWGAHEAELNGVPLSYDWAAGSRPGVWMDTDKYEGINMWGQVYFMKGGSPETDFRVQIRNMIVYKYESGDWSIVEQTPDNIGGSWFLENFDAGTSSGNKRSEANNGGGISATMIPGHTFHFWTDSWPRAQMPHQAEAIYSRLEARIIQGTDPEADLNQVKVLCGIGNDCYTTRDYSAGTNERIVSAVITRHRFLTPEWQVFNCYIAGNPPATSQDYIDEILKRPLPPDVIDPGSPVVEISNPVTNTIYYSLDDIVISADAFDEDGIIDRIDFFLNDSLLGNISSEPYNYLWTKVFPGEHTIRAIAVDNEGKMSAASETNITVYASLPPEVEFISPLNNDTVEAGTTIPIEVEAKDPDGFIQSVIFYYDGIKVGETTSFPYKIDWDPPLFGDHVIYATAWDTSGTSATTDHINIHIRSNISYIEEFDKDSLINWSVKAGNWELKNGTLFSQNASGNEFVIFDHIHFLDFSFSVKAQPLWNNWFGVIFNYQDDKNYLLVELSISGKTTQLIEVLNGNRKILATGEFPDAASLVDAFITVNQFDSLCTIRINEKTVIADILVAFGSGKIGLYTHWNPVYFDNIRIYGNGKYYPDIIITANHDNMNYLEGEDVILQIMASDIDGSIDVVKLLKDNIIINNSVIVPFDTIFSNLPAGKHVFSAQARDDEGYLSQKTAIITVNEVKTGLMNNQISDPFIFPNPLKGHFLKISIEEPVWKFEMYDLTGKTVEIVEIRGDVIYLNPGCLQSGSLYIYRIITEKQIFKGSLFYE